MCFSATFNTLPPPIVGVRASRQYHVEEEAAIPHPGRASDERRQGSQKADKAPDEHRLPAVPLKKLLHAVQTLCGDSSPAAMAHQPVSTEMPPQLIAEAVPHNRADTDREDQHIEIEHVA